MNFHNDTQANLTFKFDPTEYFDKLSTDFGRCHLNPVNVFLHFITTPIGLIGAISLLRSATKGSSAAMTLTAVYLLSLLPAVPNGVFAGTAILCGIIVYFARRLRLNYIAAILFIAAGYLLQDLAHIGTGEKTYQSTYSAGGQV
jgi:uncharacterized membrane protein YGL010W